MSQVQAQPQRPIRTPRPEPDPEPSHSSASTQVDSLKRIVRDLKIVVENGTGKPKDKDR